jgi:Protein of unknown function (DUF3800)
MYLMYADESGDPGLPTAGSPTTLFCLSGVVVHELAWQSTLLQLLQFRHWLRTRYGIPQEAELHTAEMINKPSKVHASLRQLPKHIRLAIIRQFANEIGRLKDVAVINVVLDKTRANQNANDAFCYAWNILFQRFENTMSYKNFPGACNPQERGIVFPDNTDGAKLNRLLDRMRASNRLKINHGTGASTHLNCPVRLIIENPVLRQSHESYLIQAADCCAFLLKQNLQPSSFMRKTGGNAYFERLRPVLCAAASRKDPAGLGIVRLPT